MKHITCPCCGKQNITDLEKFCPQCGFALTVSEMPAVSPRKAGQSPKSDTAFCEKDNIEPEKEIISGQGRFSLVGIICFVSAVFIVTSGAVWTYDILSLSGVSGAGIFGQLFVSVLMLVVGIGLIVLSILLSGYQITVTNKRVTRRLPFAAKINLPMESIRKVRPLGMKTVSISDN